MKEIPQKGLYAILDPDILNVDPLEIAERMLDAKVDILQLRAKTMKEGELFELAKTIRMMASKAGIPFIMNDRADVAAMIKADGLHLGQDDLSFDEARKIFDQGWIGISTHSMNEALKAEEDGADWIGFGPVFDTKTKKNLDPLVGLSQLKEVVSLLRIPVIAIGGIHEGNLHEVVKETPLVAMISALTKENQIEDNIKVLKKEIWNV